MAYLYGLLSMADLAASRVTEVGVDAVQDAIERSLTEHNRQMDAMLALFVERTQEFKGRFFSPVASRLQALDNSGRARPMKPAAKYDVSWPIQQAGIAWGSDYVTGQYMTVAEVARITEQMQDADFRWLRDHFFAGVFYKSSTNPWTFTDELHGSLSIYGLANGDATTYSIQTGADQEAIDDHLKGTATLTAATFADIRNELLEHPENMGETITFISSADQSVVEALPTYYPIADPHLQYADTVTRLLGSLATPVPGQVIGRIEQNWIVLWRSLPANYMISVTTAGVKPLRLREDPITPLRGFNRVADRDDHPWYERQYLRRAGFGAYNRVGAVVYRTNNATYTTPANYSSPMP